MEFFLDNTKPTTSFDFISESYYIILAIIYILTLNIFGVELKSFLKGPNKY